MSREKSAAAVAAGKLAHRDRDEHGNSVLALANNARIHAEKTADGKSVVAQKAGKASMAALDENGRSIHAQEAAAAAIAPEVEARRAVTRRKNLLDRDLSQQVAYIKGRRMSERGAHAQMGIWEETHRMLSRGQITRDGELVS